MKVAIFIMIGEVVHHGWLPVKSGINLFDE